MFKSQEDRRLDRHAMVLESADSAARRADSAARPGESVLETLGGVQSGGREAQD